MGRPTTSPTTPTTSPTTPTTSPTTPSTAGATVLGIETSCDETAAAVVSGGTEIRSSVVSSQVDLHATYGGVVPELAGRAHLEVLTPLVGDALARAGVSGSPPQLDAVAATIGPGLVGSLLVGVSEAKALSLAWGVPFVGVNHLEGHLFAALLEHPAVRWPLVVLLVSGGHTILVSMEGPGRYRRLGATVDDAAGEAFDKVARFLGLGYPGGPRIEQAAASGDPAAFAFPRPLLDEGLDLSFSGLKTAVVRAVRARPEASDEDVAASFQAAVVEVLVGKAVRAVEAVRAQGLCLAGGVAANGPLRRAVTTAAEELGIPAYLPTRAMCTDNAAMIAAAGGWQLEHLGPTPLDAACDPGLSLPYVA
jgi:N6-L-threonylcarbamoyladenine synthase